MAGILISRAARHAAAAAAIIATTVAFPAAARASITDTHGAVVPFTDSSSTTAQLVGSPSLDMLLADPFSDPRPAGVGPTPDPEADLAAALDSLAAAPDVAAATSARQLALDILEGNPLAGRPYSGLPLLNWNAPAKVKPVPAGGNVDVHEVRFGQRDLSDTWLLQFADPTKPYTITYHVAELGTSMGADFAPTPLLADAGTPIGGQPSIIQPLALGETPVATQIGNRFNAPGPEHTRLGVLKLVVNMPPPNLTTAILSPDLRAEHNTLTALAPDSAAREAVLTRDFAFTGTSPTPAQKSTAIGRLGGSLEKQLWSDLNGLDPAATTFLASAHTVGTDDRALVASMRTRTALPVGVAADPAADVTVLLANNETYVSKPSTRLAPGAPIKIEFINQDGFTHDLGALDLHTRRPVFGALDWGQFDWSQLDLAGTTTLAAGGKATLTLHPAGDAFSIWLGDPNSGDQAGAIVALDRGPLEQSVQAGADPFAFPAHQAQDAAGNVWVVLAGVDKIKKLTPAADLTQSTSETYPLPGGTFNLNTVLPALGPTGVAVDARGIVWSTLTNGNAIARIDPSQTHDGTSDGIRKYALGDCGADFCAPPPPPVRPGPLSRMPVQMTVTEDGAGNTLVWFDETAANSIGLLRVAPDGTQLNLVDFPCGCSVPMGISLDREGHAWFASPVENHITRLTLDATNPYDAGTSHLDNYKIPSFDPVVQSAELSPLILATSAPHSVAVDRHDRVWFTENATSKIGIIDQSQAMPGTSKGIREFDLGQTDFHNPILPADMALDRADTLFWVDEYGDAVGSMKADGTKRFWRPGDRQSRTDGPMLDSAGNFWFSEGGSNLQTRISGVTQGMPAPAHLPRVTIDQRTRTITAGGLRDIDSLDVRVLRSGSEVARIDGITLDAGAFSIGGGSARPWPAGAQHPLDSGDVVELAPHGPFAPAAFSASIPSLSGAVAADGTLGGTATDAAGSPLAGEVELQRAGGSSTAAIDRGSGAFRFAASTPLAGGALAWSGATPAAVVRTVAGFDPAAAAGAPGGLSPAAPPAPVKNAPVRSSGAGCAKAWFTRSASARNVFLLGLDTVALRRCLGAPTRASGASARGGARWRYDRRGLTVSLLQGRVNGFTIAGGAWRSAPDGVGIGSSRAALERALGRLSGSRAARTLRGTITLSGGGRAAIRIMLSGRKARRITVSAGPATSGNVGRHA
jgi:streptogramin lyase